MTSLLMIKISIGLYVFGLTFYFMKKKTVAVFTCAFATIFATAECFYLPTLFELPEQQQDFSLLVLPTIHIILFIASFMVIKIKNNH